MRSAPSDVIPEASYSTSEDEDFFDAEDTTKWVELSWSSLHTRFHINKFDAVLLSYFYIMWCFQYFLSFPVTDGGEVQPSTPQVIASQDDYFDGEQQFLLIYEFSIIT